MHVSRLVQAPGETLGASNDAGIAHEIRAAELCAQWQDERLHQLSVAEYRGLMMYVPTVSDGWCTRANPRGVGERAGWLFAVMNDGGDR